MAAPNAPIDSNTRRLMRGLLCRCSCHLIRWAHRVGQMFDQDYAKSVKRPINLLIWRLNVAPHRGNHVAIAANDLVEGHHSPRIFAGFLAWPAGASWPCGSPRVQAR